MFEDFLGLLGQGVRHRGGLLGSFLPLSPQEKQQEMVRQMALARAMQEWEQHNATLASNKEEQARKAEAAKQATAMNTSIEGILDLGRTNPTWNMPSRAPTVANAAAIPPAWQARRDAQLLAMEKAIAGGDEKRAAQLKNAAELTTPQLDKVEEMTDPSGKRVMVAVFKDGTRQILPDVGAPKKPLHFVNTGTMTGAGLDTFSGEQVSPGLPVQMSPAERDTSSRGWANYGLDKQKFDYQQGLDKAGKPTFHDGQFVYPPSAQNPQGTAVPVPGFTQKTPESLRKEVADIDSQLQIVSHAIDRVKKTPKAFGMERGLATLSGTVGESMRGRLDTKQERETRAFVFNVVSKVINERAGAAQSAQELARLRAFLPSETDDANQIVDKFNSFNAYLEEKKTGYTNSGKATTSRPGGATSGWSITEDK